MLSLMEGFEMATKHTHQVVFGRKVADCPRCAELAAGAAPIQWAGQRKAAEDARRTADIRAHFDGYYHRSGKCGPVCTFGEW